MENRFELTVMFGRDFDGCVARRDWRRLLALARWARVLGMPALEMRAEKTALRYIPKADFEILSILWRRNGKRN